MMSESVHKPSHQLLEESASFALLGRSLGTDLKKVLKDALDQGVAFGIEATTPIAVFRHAIRTAIREIESDPRGELFQAFLRKGPYVDVGPIPEDVAPEYITDFECAATVTFIHSHMVNSFKGELAELLAIRPSLDILQRRKGVGGLPRTTKLYVGDAVRAGSRTGSGRLKAADLHMLSIGDCGSPNVTVAGIAEVKSFERPRQPLGAQLNKHLARAERGLQILGRWYPSRTVAVGTGQTRRIERVSITTSNWPLPRTFVFRRTRAGRTLVPGPARPNEQPLARDRITEGKNGEWQVTLRWSEEALAEAAYELTFWYMEKVGEVVYRAGPMPSGWEDMSPAEAGRNAAKMMLYYAILRLRNRDRQRAIAIYNTYSFGYALGMNYVNRRRQREMLWPQDLDEILTTGWTKDGCRILS